MYQKFNQFDHVMIADDLGGAMDHFVSGEEAIVEYTYAERFGGNDIDSYSLYIKGHGSVAWYYEHQLTLIEKNRPDLRERWEDEQNKKDELYSDLNWIFSHGEDVLKSAKSSTIESLARCLGLTIDDLWGKNGEGITYYTNARALLISASHFLKNNDRDGWEEYCKQLSCQIKR